MNQSINVLFLCRKRAHAGSRERPIGHRVCCSLLQQPYNMKIIKRNNTKKEKNYVNSLNLHKMCCVFHQNVGHKSLFTNCAIHKKNTKHRNTQKKYTKNYNHHLTTKITFEFYRLTK